MAIELHPVAAADAERLARLYTAQREFLRPFGPVRPDEFFTLDGQAAALRQAERERAEDRCYRFLILAGGRPVGRVGVSNVVRGAFQSAHLGYWVAREHNGRGIATDAVAQATRWAFGDGRLHRLEAGTLVDNAASRRVLEKNGFHRIGISMRHLRIAGEWRDHVIYAKTADDGDD